MTGVHCPLELMFLSFSTTSGVLSRPREGGPRHLVDPSPTRVLEGLPLDSWGVGVEDPVPDDPESYPSDCLEMEGQELPNVSRTGGPVSMSTEGTPALRPSLLLDTTLGLHRRRRREA